MINVVLIAPEIPQNTGNIGRLCVNCSARLHLIRPLGFDIDQTAVRRAGLDYWEWLDLRVHKDWEQFFENEQVQRLFFLSTRGRKSLFECTFQTDDYLVFGNEGSGLPAPLYERHSDDLFKIPMPGERCRSLNLANSVSIAIYEALRQINHW